MEYLLDTNMVTALMEENTKFLEHLQNLSENDSVMTTVFTYGEIYYGINILPQCKKRKRLEQKANQAFSDLLILSADARVATYYFKIKSDLKKKGRPFNAENDLWIAATAVANQMCLATDDAHFKEVDDLQIEDWIKD